MYLESQAFVLERRINVAPVQVLHVALERSSFSGGSIPVLNGERPLRFDEPFRLFDFGRLSVWRANARLRDARGRTAARVELEIGLWSPADTQLLVRPQARHPERWSRARLRRYFAHAHATADALTSHFMHAAAVNVIDQLAAVTV